ncbi:MAG: hypothetical protein J6Z29_08745 [Ruminococcus sp.]|uniref:hypothetical protein n=1 Tax=uncultured Ruminococcus sp. TaxID=165186 RepID=UPI001B797791|nr:hypothetical protein [uncultured Ruminococcus sp.]MBP5268644.1 hypothetical protein [Ruminococcus sp.]
MKTVYRRLICCCCVIFAAVCMGSVSAVTAFAESGGEVHSAQTEEQNDNDWQIFACMGAGAVIVLAIICLLADKKKK